MNFSFSLQQFSALECLRRFVDEKYHYLILKNQPKLEILLDTYADHENEKVCETICSCHSDT